MKDQTGLVLRGNTYGFRRRIPADLRDHYKGREAVSYSLGTSNKAQARQMVCLEHVKWDQEWQRIRNLKAEEPRVELSDLEIERMSELVYRSLLTVDESLRADGHLKGSLFDVYGEALEKLSSRSGKHVARGEPDGADSATEKFLERFGVKIEQGAEQYQKISYAFAKARRRAYEEMRSRHAGDVVTTPKDGPEVAIVPGTTKDDDSVRFGIAAPEAPKSVCPKLSEVIQHFMGKQEKQAPMYKKYLAATSLVLEVLGDRLVSELRQKEIDDFFDLLCKLPPRWSDKKRQLKVGVVKLAAMEWPKCMAPKTFEDTYMAAIRPFLRETVRVFGDQGFPRHLTVEGIKYSGIRERDERKQRALRADELKRLYEGPEFVSFASNPEQEHFYWLPLIGLYTGARVNEVCQLNPKCDIRQEYGIWVFDITDDSETDERVRKSVKNKTSHRLVPIHSELIRLGFLDYVEKIKKQAAAILFPQLPPSRGKASGAGEKWFRGLIETTGLRDETPGLCVLGFHTFRSTLLNRAMNLMIDYAHWLTGHTQENISMVVRGYQGQAEVVKKQEILERITYEVSIPPRQYG